MRIRTAILGDLHLGRVLYQHDLTPDIRRTMYCFLDFCREHQVHNAVQLGDVFDTPTPTEILRKFFAQWCNEFRRAGISLFVMTGNHDVTGNPAAPSALEAFKCRAHTTQDSLVRVIDRPTYTEGLLLLPFPSPGIFTSFSQYCTDIPVTGTGALAFTHLNVQGATLNDQDFVYRGGDYYIPADLRVNMVVAGHIHKPQRVGNIRVIGSAERLRFNEHRDSRYFGLLRGNKLSLHRNEAALRFKSIELDVSGWANDGDIPTTLDVMNRLREEDIAGVIVKVTPIIDEASTVEWAAVREGLYKAGVRHAVIAPPVKLNREVKQRKQTRQTLDPVHAAAGFIKGRVQDVEERKKLMRHFKLMLKESAR